TSPMLGIGLHAMPQTIIARKDHRTVYSAQPVHNVPMLSFVEVGVVGVFVLALVFGAVFVHVLGGTSPWYWVVILPALLFDHHLWSLATGPILLLMLIAAVRITSPRADPS
ncbi:MAG: hypothetical protein ABIG71_00030, partial [Candidatus Uhrbacteria bacterium]